MLEHKDLIDDFNAFDIETSKERQLSARDRDYYDHKQFSEDRRNEYKERGQPCVTYNRIQPKVNYLLGAERSNRTDPRVLPRSPKHTGDADAVTKALRYIIDETNFDNTSSDTFLNQIVEGTGAAIVEFNPDREEIEINYIPWDRLYWDMHSRRADFSDACKMGIVLWMYFDDAKAMVRRVGGEIKEGELETYIRQAMSEASLFDDKPEATRWISAKSKRVQIFQEYVKKDGKWHEVFFHKGGIIKEGLSPYLDCDGLPTNPIHARSSYVDREGKRFGAVRGWISAQNEINDRRSKALHEIHSNLTIGDQEVVDVATMKREKNKPNGHIVKKNPNGLFEFVDRQSEVSNQLTMLQEAKAEIDAQGVNAALTGAESRDLSGRGILALQQGGITELGPLFDVHKMWKRNIFTACFERAKQFWDEKWVRITDKPDDIRFVGFNRPVTYRMIVEAHAEATGEQIPPEMLDHPQINEVAKIENDLSELEVDIVITESPDSATLAQEQFTEIAKLASVRGDIPTTLLIKLSSIPGKDDVLEELEGGEKQKEALAQEAQLQKALQDELAKAEVAKTTAEAQNEQLDSEKKRAEVEKVEAETNQTLIENELMLAQQSEAQVII